MEATRWARGWSDEDVKVHESLSCDYTDGDIMDEMPSSSSSSIFPIRYRFFSGSLLFIIAAFARCYTSTLQQKFKEEGHLAMIEKSIVEITDIRESAHEIEQHAQRLSTYAKNQLALHLQRQEKITAEDEAIETEIMQQLEKLLDLVESTKEEALDLVLTMADKVDVEGDIHEVPTVTDNVDVEGDVYEVLSVADKVDVKEVIDKSSTERYDVSHTLLRLISLAAILFMFVMLLVCAFVMCCFKDILLQS